MKLERKYFWILFWLFSIISLGITYTAYTLANTILIQKHTELYENESKYLLSLTENELDQLNNTFDFLGNNDLIQEALSKLDGEHSDYETLMASAAIDSSMAALNTFDLVTSIQVLTIRMNEGQEYWYGLGNNYSENHKIEEDVSKLEIGDADFVYIRLDNTFFRMSSVEQVLQFVQFIHGRNGEQNGYLFFELNPSYFNKIFGEYQTTVASEVYFIDGESKILYTNTTKKVGELLDESEIQLTDEKDVVIKEKLSRYDWQLIIKSSKKQITKSNSLILQVTLLTAFVSIIIEILAILLIIRSLFKPIKALSEGLELLTEGNFDSRVHVDSKDEIGLACVNFNILADTLQTTIQKELDYQLQLKDSEYKALQAQINPHFLYNSLNALKWMASVQHLDNITKMVDSLWKLFKSASHQKGQFVTIEEELDLIEAYTHIQQVRYKHKFSVELEVDPSLKQRKIPKLILQPLVENSIFHGIAPKEDDGVIRIVVQEDAVKEFLASECEIRELILTIIDDGVGMTKSKIEEILSDKAAGEYGQGMNNLAVYNIRDRLELLYGRSDLLLIESVPCEGTTIQVRIPVTDNDREDI